MIAEELVPVTAGHGRKIHAGRVTGEVTKGRVTYKTYKHICGTGNSSHFHNFNVAHARLAQGQVLADVNCGVCLRLIAHYKET